MLCAESLAQYHKTNSVRQIEPKGKGLYRMSKLCVGKLWSISVCFIILTKINLREGMLCLDLNV